MGNIGPLFEDLKYLSFDQQKSLLVSEIRKTMRGVKPGAPFAHFFRCFYDAKVGEAVTLELSQELGQAGRYFPEEAPNKNAWIEFAGKPF